MPTAAAVVPLAVLLVLQLLRGIWHMCCGTKTKAAQEDDNDEQVDLELTLKMLSAIESDEPSRVSAAVKEGAQLHGPLRGACGITAPQLAALLGKCSALRELQDLGADLVECHPNRMLGGNCIHGAALGSHASATRYLIEQSGLYLLLSMLATRKSPRFTAASGSNFMLILMGAGTMSVCRLLKRQRSAMEMPHWTPRC